MLHLAISLVRSKLTYGQEVYFSAPKIYLKKLQSLDSKAIKLALGLPVHASTICSYREAGILPLDEYRKLAAAKYVIRAFNVDNCTNKELELKSDVHFPKRSNQTPSLLTLASYTSDIFEKCQIDPKLVATKMSVGAF